MRQVVRHASGVPKVRSIPRPTSSGERRSARWRCMLILTIPDNWSCLTINMAVMIHTYDGESLAALKFVASIEFEKVGAERGSTADQRCTRSEPAAFLRRFRSLRCARHTPHTPARQPSCHAHISAPKSAPVSPSPLNAHMRSLLPFRRSRSMRETSAR